MACFIFFNVSIDLPITIPRSMFDRELDYYGITLLRGIAAQESLPQIMDSFTVTLAEAQKKHDAFLLAYECYNRFCQHRLEEPKSKVLVS